MKTTNINIWYKDSGSEYITEATVWRITEHQLEVRLKSGNWINIPLKNILKYEVSENE